MMITKDLLNKRICDVEKGTSNTQTYLEFIRESEKEFNMKKADFEKYSDEELTEYFEFLDYLWEK